MEKVNGNKKKVYIRPEDICELIIDQIDNWKSKDVIKNNVSKILWYLKHEKFDKLQSEFNL